MVFGNSDRDFPFGSDVTIPPDRFADQTGPVKKRRYP